jgi:deoxycytidine triphosphate deaminase
MYLSDRDLQWAIERNLLIVQPPEGLSPPKVDPTSIDLRLDKVSEAKIWDIDKFTEKHGMTGIGEPELRLGRFKFGAFAEEYLIPPPNYKQDKYDDRVCQRGEEVLVRPGGFLLWQTKEKIGTPLHNPQYICFVDGKSTRARTGILVHLTAPTIHAGWKGNVVLEIVNLGPFTFVLREDDVIAQLTVATISSSPQQSHAEAGSSTFDQARVAGKQPRKPASKPKTTSSSRRRNS